LSSDVPDSRIGRILAEQGESIHHVSFEVQGIEREMNERRASGVRLLDTAPRTGIHGRKVAFVDPAETSGIQVEMVEEPPSRRRP
jgi:methylmalonyl-CoA/ethylmalonyl-CoA epimerase